MMRHALLCHAVIGIATLLSPRHALADDETLIVSCTGAVTVTSPATGWWPFDRTRTVDCSKSNYRLDACDVVETRKGGTFVVARPPSKEIALGDPSGKYVYYMPCSVAGVQTALFASAVGDPDVERALRNAAHAMQATEDTQDAIARVPSLANQKDTKLETALKRLDQESDGTLDVDVADNTITLSVAETAPSSAKRAARRLNSRFDDIYAGVRDAAEDKRLAVAQSAVQAYMLDELRMSSSESPETTRSQLAATLELLEAADRERTNLNVAYIEAFTTTHRVIDGELDDQPIGFDRDRPIDPQ